MLYDTVIDQGVTYLEIKGADKYEAFDGEPLGRSMRNFFSNFRCNVEYDIENDIITVKKMPEPLYNELKKEPVKLFINGHAIDAFLDIEGREYDADYPHIYADEFPYADLYCPLVETLRALGAQNINETEFDCAFEYDGREYVCQKNISMYELGEWDSNKGVFGYNLKMYSGKADEDRKEYYMVRINEFLDFGNCAVIENGVMYIRGETLFRHFGYAVEAYGGGDVEDGLILIKDDEIDFSDTFSPYLEMGGVWEVAEKVKKYIGPPLVLEQAAN